MTLDQLPIHQKATILENKLDEVPLKLIELGILPHMEVEVLVKNFSSDPIYFRVEDNYLSIRKDLAQRIEVAIKK